jgi:transposase
MVMRLVAGHKHSAQEIAEMAGVSRVTVFRNVERFMEGGMEGLLARNYRGGKRATLSSRLQQQLVEKLEAGEFIRAKEAQAWVKKETGRKLALNTMYYWLGKSRESLESAAQDLTKRKTR